MAYIVNCLKVFSILLLTFLSSGPLASSEKIDVLLCLYDLGDSNFMKRVMNELDRHAITYKILPFGKAIDVFKGNDKVIQLELPEIKDDREKTLEPSDLNRIKNAVKPRLVIAGMASSVQAQVLNLFKDQGAYTVAFYDNFDSILGKEYVRAFLNRIGQIDEYFLPSETTLSGFQKLKQTDQAKLSVLGQPTLEDWDDVFSKTNKDDLKRRLGVNPKDKVILFVGGYDDTYREYFHLFVKTMKGFQKDPALKVFVTYHPKTDGKLEKEIVAEESASLVKIIDKEGPSTAQIATIADVLLCHKSSVGIQALYMGLPVVYVVKKGDLTNFAIQQGLAYEVEEEASLVQILKSLLLTANRNRAALQGLGIPKNATINIAERIKALIQKSP